MLFSFRGSQSTRSREEFWARLEAELGQPILASTLGRYMEGRETAGPLWGLLYITADALYFRHFAQTNWFSSMMSTDGEDGPVWNKNVTLKVSLSEVATVIPPIPRSGLMRLFQSQDRVFRLRSTSHVENQEDFVFSVEGAMEPFSEELQAAVSRLQ